MSMALKNAHTRSPHRNPRHCITKIVLWTVPNTCVISSWKFNILKQILAVATRIWNHFYLPRQLPSLSWHTIAQIQLVWHPFPCSICGSLNESGCRWQRNCRCCTCRRCWGDWSVWWLSRRKRCPSRSDTSEWERWQPAKVAERLLGRRLFQNVSSSTTPLQKSFQTETVPLIKHGQSKILLYYLERECDGL